MKADQPEPYGFIVSSEIDGGGYPAFKIQRLLGPREDCKVGPVPSEVNPTCAA